MPKPVATSDVILERLLSRRIITLDGCWEYDGCRTKDGYGQIKVGGRAGKVRYTHAVAYELLVGDVPKGLILDHRVCDNPPCFNPDHLLPCTHRENILRGTGMSAIYAARTHCDDGHELSGDNLYRHPRGWRGCRTCRRRWMQDFYARRIGVGA